MSNYETKLLPGGLHRVVDLEDERVDGVWNQKEKVWLDIRGLIDS